MSNYGDGNAAQLVALNRTSVELKSGDFMQPGPPRAAPLNRTSVELKLSPPPNALATHSRLLIEPVWN